MFQLTAARRRLAHFARARRLGEIGFNSQPPEGGWVLKIRKELRDGWFQLTAARRRLAPIGAM